MSPNKEFEEFIDGLPPHEYLTTHRKRYLETYKRFSPYLKDGNRIAELGYLSPVSVFLRDHRGFTVAEITCDLRGPWPVESGEFDAILSLEVLEHIHDRVPPGCALEELITFTGSGARNKFSEVHRVLRKGGRLLLTTPNANSIDTVANVITGKHPFQYKLHVREYAPQDVIEMAVDAGFDLETADTYFAWQVYSDEFRKRIGDAAESLGYPIMLPGDDAIFSFVKR